MALQLSRVNGQLHFEGVALKVTSRANNAQLVKPLPSDKVLVTVWLPTGLVARFKAVAANRRESLRQFASILIYQVVQDVPLSSEDFRQIAADMRKLEAVSTF